MKLSLRTQKSCFVLATAVCLAVTVAVTVWGIQSPQQVSGAPSEAVQTATALEDDISGAAGHEPKREHFAALWDHPLRRVLYDPPPPKPEVKQLPPLRLELLGTILEPLNSMAIIRSEQGTIEYKRVGDVVGPGESPANVVEIGSESIIVERAAERITLGVQSKNRR
jgi:hypothetical protein